MAWSDLYFAVNKIDAVGTQSTTTDPAADELLKWKKLLDVGAITQDEFNAKKKQLLGL
ncbi:MAG: SHOCT domain-containing protein [Treponema sp.]|nr:SHOCT domain-containing protein [Treponema sp.]